MLSCKSEQAVTAADHESTERWFSFYIVLSAKEMSNSHTTQKKTV